MNTFDKIKYKDTILLNESERYCEIYKITNNITNKCYVGQAVSHILNHKKYRPYGSFRRFNGHVSEAYSTKKNQCHYLNNSIRKNGKDNFKVEILEYCEIKEADEREKYYIKKHNTLFPNGYNLNSGGLSSSHTEESKKRVSNGVIKYYENKKYERFKNIYIDKTKIDKYIKPLRRDNKQYGWYVLISRKKADFGGVHINLDDSKNMAITFINNLVRIQEGKTP
jgi:group I intron endonuclease